MKAIYKIYHPGPGISSLRPHARVVLEADTPLNQPLEREQLQKAMNFLRSASRIQADTYVSPAGTAAQIFLESALLVQRCFVYPVSWGKTVPLAENRTEIAFEIARPRIFSAVTGCALAMTRSALATDRARKPEDILRQFQSDLTPEIKHIYAFDRLKTAARLGIFAQTAPGMPEGQVQVGQGISSRLLAPGFTDLTSHLGRELAGNKIYARQCLKAAGLPTPSQFQARGEENIVMAAEDMGCPVVLKPVRGSKSRKVVVGLQHPDEIRKACRETFGRQARVLVEEYLQGMDYRMLVIGGEFAAAALRLPLLVTGDGLRTVAELISMTNEVQRRQGWILGVVTINLDNEILRVLAAQNLAPDSVPEPGRDVILRRNSSGESLSRDITSLVHPDNRDLAVAAARACRLDVAGIDFNSPDISRSWKTGAGSIVEVNAGPAVDIHMYPQQGKWRDMSWKIIRSCLPARAPGRIGVIMNVCGSAKQVLSKKAAALLNMLGIQAETALDPGLSRAGDQHTEPFMETVAAKLMNRDTQALVLDISLPTMAQEGLALDRVAVTVLGDAQSWPDLAHEQSEAQNTLSRAIKLAVDCACAAVVINAHLPGPRQACSRLPSRQVVYAWDSCRDDDSSYLDSHIQAGGRAIVAREEQPGMTCVYSVTRRGKTLVGALPSGISQVESQEMMNTLLFLASIIAAGIPGPEPEAFPLVLFSDDLVPAGLLTNPPGRPALAVCDCRSSGSMARLLQFIKPASDGSVWMIVDAQDDFPLRQCAESLEPARVFWCCAGLERKSVQTRLESQGVKPSRIILMENIDQAWKYLEPRLGPEDALVLLTRSPGSASQLLENSLEPLTDSRKEFLWEAPELSRIFNGSWVNGPEAGWGCQGLALDPGEIQKGDLAIIPGDPQDPRSLPQVEKDISLAFDLGARAVASVMVPLDLERWKPVLVCDHPEQGLERMADLGRKRFKGKVVALSGMNEPELFLAFCEVLANNHLDRQRLFYDRRMTGTHSIKQTQAALARTPGRAEAGIYPAGFDLHSLSIVDPALWIALPRNPDENEQCADLLGFIRPEYGVILAVPGSRNRFWRERLKDRSGAVLLETGEESGPSRETLKSLARTCFRMLNP